MKCNILFFVFISFNLVAITSCYKVENPPCQDLPTLEGTVTKIGDCGWAVVSSENQFPYFADEGLPEVFWIEGLELRVFIKKDYEDLFQCNADTSGATFDYPYVFIFSPCQYQKI